MLRFRRFVSIILSGMIHLSLIMAVAADPVWQNGADIPVSVRAGNTATYARNDTTWLYIVSGRNAEERIVKTVQRYNAATSVWDTVASHPTGLLGAATAVAGDYLFIIGGVINPPGAGIRTVHRYHIPTDRWETMGQLPFGWVDGKAVAYQDSLIYVAGGFVNGRVYGLVYVYNRLTDTWREATRLPIEGRLNYGGFTLVGNTLIYMCGTSGFQSPTVYNAVHIGQINRRNSAEIAWRAGEPFPGQTRTFFDAHPWGDSHLIMSGGSTDNTFQTDSPECYVFNPTANIWTRLPDKPTSWLTGQSGSVRLSDAVWKLICTGGYGAEAYLSHTEILTDTLDATALEPSGTAGTNFQLAQNFPNPFRLKTTIRYVLPETSGVSIKIFNAAGQEVRVLVADRQSAGAHEVVWDGRNQSGEPVSPGVYIYRLQSNERSQTRQLTLLK